MEPVIYYYAKAKGFFYLLFTVVFGCVFLFATMRRNNIAWHIGMLLGAVMCFLFAVMIWKNWVAPAMRNEQAIILNDQGISGYLVKQPFPWSEIETILLVPTGKYSVSIGIKLTDPERFLAGGLPEKERTAVDRRLKRSGVHFYIPLQPVKAKEDDVELTMQEFQKYYANAR